MSARPPGARVEVSFLWDDVLVDVIEVDARPVAHIGLPGSDTRSALLRLTVESDGIWLETESGPLRLDRGAQRVGPWTIRAERTAQLSVPRGTELDHQDWLGASIATTATALLVVLSLWMPEPAPVVVTEQAEELERIVVIATTLETEAEEPAPPPVPSAIAARSGPADEVDTEPPPAASPKPTPSDPRTTTTQPRGFAGGESGGGFSVAGGTLGRAVALTGVGGPRGGFSGEQDGGLSGSRSLGTSGQSLDGYSAKATGGFGGVGGSSGSGLTGRPGPGGLGGAGGGGLSSSSRPASGFGSAKAPSGFGGSKGGGSEALSGAQMKARSEVCTWVRMNAGRSLTVSVKGGAVVVSGMDIQCRSERPVHGRPDLHWSHLHKALPGAPA